MDKPIDEAVLDRACEAYAEIADDCMGLVRRKAMSAALTAAQQQGQGGGEAAPEPFAWFAFADQNGPVPLEVYGWDRKSCLYAVLTLARSEGWKGTVNGYLFHKGWTVKPAYTAPPSAPVAADWITGDGLQGIKAEAHFLTQHKEEAVQRAGKRLLDRADKIIAALYQPPSAPVRVEGLMQLAREWCLSWGEWAHDADPGCAKENAAEAALRAALTQALAQQPAAVALSREELDTCRQWFDSVQDTNGGYLTPDDYVLAEKLYRIVGMRVPDSIGRIAAQPGGSDNG